MLAKGEDFDSNISAALEEDAGGTNQGKDEWQHGLVLTWTQRCGRTAPQDSNAVEIRAASSFGNTQGYGMQQLLVLFPIALVLCWLFSL